MMYFLFLFFIRNMLGKVGIRQGKDLFSSTRAVCSHVWARYGFQGWYHDFHAWIKLLGYFVTFLFFSDNILNILLVVFSWVSLLDHFDALFFWLFSESWSGSLAPWIFQCGYQLEYMQFDDRQDDIMLCVYSRVNVKPELSWFLLLY